MARIDKIIATTTTLVGQQVRRAAIVAPPGSAAYRNVGGGSGYSAASIALGAIRSRRDGGANDGAAATFPTSFGLLAACDDTVFYCKTHKLSGQPTEILAQWPADALKVTYVPKTGKMRNPAIDIEFDDGSSVLAFGEKKWGIEQFA